MAPAKSFATYRVNLSGLRADIAAHTAVARGTKQSIALPLPDGRFVDVQLTRADVLVPEIQAANPGIQTFKGVSADGEYSVRLTVSPYGAFARIHTPEDGLVYIQPLENSAPEWSAVYFARDADDAASFRCGVSSEDEKEESSPSSKTTAFSYRDGSLRTYVMAVSSNGEYTTWAGGKAQALAQITATVNNLNAVFERDLGATFTVNSPDSVRYTNASSDPFGTTLDAPLLLDNHAILNNVVGVSNYGFGHLFSALNWGGLAYTGVCNSARKGGAASGTPTPTGAGWENLVAHEIGHQFGASHSFSASNGSCGGNISAANGWEPGGGSTIMAYAGACTGNFYQNNTESYFHGGSLSQMSTYAAGSGNSCATLSTPANAAPSLSVSPLSYTIPNGTAFRLSGTGTDANNTGLTYAYEQLDAVGGSGISTAPTATATTGPLFRSFPPSTSNTRYLPNLAAQFAGTATPYEVLPTVARAINFRATVRDNNTGFGRITGENIVVNTASYGPFQITSQNTAGSYTADGTNQMTLTWDTAGAFACPNVTLKFTRDRGATFITLLASTANDGSETFNVPNLPTCDGRLMLECSNNIYYDVNSAAVSIASSCAANGATFSPSSYLATNSAGDPALNQNLSAQYGAQYGTISGSITSADPAGTLTVYNTSGNSCTNYNGNITRYDAYPITPGTSGTYTFTGDGGNPFGLVYNLYEGTYNPSSPCSGFLMSSGTNTGSLGNSVSASLCANKLYNLVVSSYSNTLPTLPANYTMTVSGGNAYSGAVDPGGSFYYSYVIVNSSTSNIVAIQNTGDMSNGATFPAGLYTVYGVSSGATAAALAGSFPAGTPFATFQAAALNQTSGLCASLSSNNRSVNIGSVPLPVASLRFDAALTNRRSARASWTVTAEAPQTSAYQVERSYDGQRFVVAVTQPATGAHRYDFAEEGLDEHATGVYYRLATRKLSSDVQYTSNVYLPFASAAATASLMVAPNPVQGGVLRAQVGAASEGIYTASVMDATGRVVYGAKLELGRGVQPVEIPVKELSAGVYILRIQGVGAPMQARFVKSK